MKQTDKRLAPMSPEPGAWKSLAAYLVKGQRPAGSDERAILRAYLDMKEHLGPAAAFRLGAELEYSCLAGPCAGFFDGKETLGDGQRLLHWSCFLLAADHLLARAHEASLAERNNRSKAQAALEAEWERCQKEFFQPLSQEMSTGRQSTDAPGSKGRGLPSEAEAVAA